MQPRLRRARLVTLGALTVNAGTALFLPSVGLAREPDGTRVVLGAVGIVLFCAAQVYVLYALVTPWADRRRPAVAFAVVSVASLPLVGPVGGHWPSWSWLAACLVGVIPVLVPGAVRWVLVGGVVAVAVLVAPDVVWHTVVITAGVGLGLASVNGLQLWFWDLLLQAEQGRAAQSRLAAAQERLRFARDVHDLLGHRLSVIALKAELAERLAPLDAERARTESAEVRVLASTTLAELRDVVRGYRRVDLAEQLDAIRQVLGSSGVRCEPHAPVDVPQDAAPLLAAVLREATTNLLRHSRATRCTIEVTASPEGVRIVIANDGAAGTVRDPDGSGLRGLADRLAEAGGTFASRLVDDTFTVEAVVPSDP
jgi:two-component system sensor histidine kinase DesK